jgi:hypothetical protein
LESPVVDVAGNPVDINKTIEELNLMPPEVMFGVTPAEWKQEVCDQKIDKGGEREREGGEAKFGFLKYLV